MTDGDDDVEDEKRRHEHGVQSARPCAGPSGRIDPADRLDIAVFCSSLAVVRGGLESIMTALAEGLAARGHRVTVVAGRHGRRLHGAAPGRFSPVVHRVVEIPFLPVTAQVWRHLPHRPGWPLEIQSLSFLAGVRAHPAARHLVRTVDVTLTTFEAETVAIAAWRGRRGKPNVSYLPGVIDRRRLRRDRSAVRLAISTMVADATAAAGIDVDVVVTPGVPDLWLQRPYAVREDGRTLLFVGRLEPEKDPLMFVELCARLAARVPSLRGRLVGEGSLRGRVEARIRASGLDGRVRCVGPLDAAGVAEEMSGADVLLLPSTFESFGLAPLEAMAIGVPVVASDLPATRESLGDVAVLVPAGDRAAWEDAVVGLLDDGEERRARSRAGRERAAGFMWSRAAATAEGWCRTALSRGAAPRPSR